MFIWVVPHADKTKQTIEIPMAVRIAEHSSLCMAIPY
jgi:hypothetical protein